MNWERCLFIISLGAFLFSCDTLEDYKQWDVYGGSNERIQYSALNEIDTSNIKNIQVAWIYQTNDSSGSSQIETNPLIINDVLYGLSPKLKLFALDAATGKEKWVFDPAADIASDNADKTNYGINICRGVAFYKGENNNNLIFYVIGPWLYSISSLTGKPVRTFGNRGRISLYDGLDVEKDRNIKDLRITLTTPGIIYKDIIIIGSSVGEEADAIPGHIRAYDVHTGKIRWIFHTIPHPGEVGYDDWEDPEAYKYVGGANCWGGLSLDKERGLVFASTGSATPDFYGGKRKGNNLFANCVLALDAVTGRLVWYYQVVHHDLWDWDLPTSPILVSIKKDGKKIDAVVQVAKHGFTFILDRVTGKPVYPIEERPVPTFTELKGERLSPTQPFPTFIAPFIRQELSESDINKIIPDSSYQDIKNRFMKYKSGAIFTPPSKQGTIVMALNGGAEWGGPAFDPATGVLYVNANEMPWIVTMKEVENNEVISSKQTNLQAGKILYNNNCQACHGSSLSGSGDFPSLIGIEKRYNEATFKSLISLGRNRMPAFTSLAEAEKTALASYVLNMKTIQREKFIVSSKKIDPFYKVPYKPDGYQQFRSKEGYPAISPPWGILSAIDLNTGKLVWKNTLGDYPELKAKGIHSGTENFGGPVVTAGGLLFIAATKDEKLRVYNKRTGELLKEIELPAVGRATPSIYRSNGKQFVVIACGRSKRGSKSGNTYVAFSLSK